MWHVLGKFAYSILMGKPDGKRQLGNTGVDVRIIFKRIFKD
jgi:hypothetical protein